MSGDLKGPDVHGSSQTNHVEDEENVLELFEEGFFRQDTDFPSCCQNLLDISS